MTVLLDITFSGMEQSSYPPLIYLCVSFHAVWLPKKNQFCSPVLSLALIPLWPLLQTVCAISILPILTLHQTKHREIWL